jgi:hypothetical protein
MNRSLSCSTLSRSRKFLALQQAEESGQLSREVVGLFTDGTTNVDGSIRNLGVTYQTTPSFDSAQSQQKHGNHIPQIGVPDITFRRQDHGSFWSTTARLERVADIEMWRRGNRVLGLKLQHHGKEESCEVLGQYDPCFPGEISTIFDQELHGALTGLLFKFNLAKKVGWGDHDTRFVSEVKIATVNDSFESPTHEEDAMGDMVSFRNGDVSTIILTRECRREYFY